MTFSPDKKYDDNVNYAFFESVGVLITKLLPWQFALSHPDIPGRFMWYPASGALIYEKPEWGVHKVGNYTDSEEVWEQMTKKVQS